MSTESGGVWRWAATTPAGRRMEVTRFGETSLGKEMNAAFVMPPMNQRPIALAPKINVAPATLKRQGRKNRFKRGRRHTLIIRLRGFIVESVIKFWSLQEWENPSWKLPFIKNIWGEIDF